MQGAHLFAATLRKAATGRPSGVATRGRQRLRWLGGERGPAPRLPARLESHAACCARAVWGPRHRNHVEKQSGIFTIREQILPLSASRSQPTTDMFKLVFALALTSSYAVDMAYFFGAE